MVVSRRGQGKDLRAELDPLAADARENHVAARVDLHGTSVGVRRGSVKLGHVRCVAAINSSMRSP